MVVRWRPGILVPHLTGSFHLPTNALVFRGRQGELNRGRTLTLSSSGAVSRVIEAATFFLLSYHIY